MVIKIIRLFSFLSALVIILSGCSKNEEAKVKEAERKFAAAKTLSTEGYYKESISLYKEAISLFKEVKSDTLVAKALLSFAQCENLIGEYDSAIARYRQALSIFNKLGEKKSVRQVEIELANLYLRLGQYSDARLIADNAAATARVFSDTADIYSALSCVAESYHKNGDYDDEIQILYDLNSLDSVFYKSENKCSIIEKQIEAFEFIGQHDRAVQLFEQLKIQAEMSNKPEDVVNAYLFFGNLLKKLGNYRDAFSAFATALSKMDKQLDKSLQADVLSSLGCLAYRFQHYEDSRRYFNEALTVIKGENNQIYESMLKLFLNVIDWKFYHNRVINEETELIKNCSEIQLLFQQIGYRLGEAFAMFVKARMLEQSDTSKEVIKLYKKVLEIVKEQPILKSDEDIISNVIKTFFEVENLNWYMPVLQYYCNANETGDLFSANERFLSSRIMKFFTNLNIQTREQSLNKLIIEYQWKQKCILLVEDDLVNEISKGKNSHYEKISLLQERRLKLQEDIYALIDKFKTSKTNYLYILTPTEVKLDEIKKSLLLNEAIIEYVLLPNAVCGIVITYDSSSIFKKDIQYQKIKDQINEYNHFLSDSKLRGANERAIEISEILGEILFKTGIQNLIKYDKLYIISSPDFGFLPIHTLKLNGNLILEKFDVSYLPTAKSLLFKEQPEKQIKNIVGIGHPGLTSWDVEYELMDIRSFYDSAKILVNESANLNLLKSYNYDLLHIATEFHLDENVPNNSKLILSDEKINSDFNKISFGDILGLVPPQVLIFSNVSTTSGDLMNFVPLGFLANGTSTILANMWQGERKARRYFDEVLYTKLKAGAFASSAYRDAIISMYKNSEYAELHSCGMFYKFGK